MSDIITSESIATLSGAFAAVLVVCNVIYYIFNFNPKLLGLVISLKTSYAITEITNIVLAKFYNIFIMILNGFLIYATAVGINTVTGKPGSPPPGPDAGGGYASGGTLYKTRSRFGGNSFFKPWY